MPEVEVVGRSSDGEEVTVTIDTDATGLRTPEEINERYVTRTQHRAELNRATDGMVDPEDAIDDEEFLERVASRRSDYFRERFGGGGDQDVDVEEIRHSVRESVVQEEVEPLRETVQGLESENAELRREKLSREVAEFGALKNDMVPVIQRYYRPGEDVAWDPDYAEWFIIDRQKTAEASDGKPKFRFSKRAGEDDVPYMTVAEDLESKRRSGEFPTWFEDVSRDTVDVQDAGGGGGGRRKLTLETFEEMSPSERRKLKQNRPELWRKMMDAKREKAQESLTEQSGGGIFG